MNKLLPIQTPERETFMDVLRGFAILGIFIANLRAFTEWHVDPKTIGHFLRPALDEKALFVHHFFIEGKFYSIFSFLFGWGIALQLTRLEVKGMRSVAFVRRRLTVMLLLGAVHLLMWSGDIVFFYGLMGFLLLFFRRFSDKTLLITAFFLMLSPILLYYLKMKFPLIFNAPAMALFGAGGWLDERLTGVTSDDAYRAFIRNASWWDIIKSNISGFFFRYADLFFQSRISKVLGLMLTGLVVGRSGFYRNIEQHKNILYSIIAIGIIVGLPANYMLAKYMDSNDGSYYNLKINGFYQTIAYALGVAPLALTYIALLMLAFMNNTGKRLLSLLSPVGKMAFTNYMMHTVIGCLVFYHAGLGYIGQVGPFYYTFFAFFVFIFQVIFSTIWLRYFNYGPIEWLWRSGTYSKWQPMKKIMPLSN